MAVLDDRAKRAGALRGEPAAHLTRSRRRAGGERARSGRRTAPCPPATGARRPRSSRTRRASSTAGRASGRGTPMRRRSTARARSSSRPADRASGYWTTRSDADPTLNARTSGVYLRAETLELEVLDSESEKPWPADRAAPPGLEESSRDTSTPKPQQNAMMRSGTSVNIRAGRARALSEAERSSALCSRDTTPARRPSAGRCSQT